MILEMLQTPAKARKVAGSKCSPRIPLTQWSDWHLPHHCPMPWVPAAASLVEVAKLGGTIWLEPRLSVAAWERKRNSKPQSQPWINRGIKPLCKCCIVPVEVPVLEPDEGAAQKDEEAEEDQENNDDDGENMRKWWWQHVFNTFASSNRVAAVRLPILKQRVHLVRMHQACADYIIVQHGFFLLSNHVHVQSCSNFETQWSGPTPALPPSLTHWLMRIVGIAGIWDCWPHRE